MCRRGRPRTSGHEGPSRTRGGPARTTTRHGTLSRRTREQSAPICCLWAYRVSSPSSSVRHNRAAHCFPACGSYRASCQTGRKKSCRGISALSIPHSRYAVRDRQWCRHGFSARCHCGWFSSWRQCSHCVISSFPPRWWTRWAGWSLPLSRGHCAAGCGSCRSAGQKPSPCYKAATGVPTGIVRLSFVFSYLSKWICANLLVFFHLWNDNPLFLSKVKPLLHKNGKESTKRQVSEEYFLYTNKKISFCKWLVIKSLCFWLENINDTFKVLSTKKTGID